MMPKRTFSLLTICLIVVMFCLPAASWALSAQRLDTRVNETLSDFQTKVEGASTVLQSAKGVLVMPAIYQGGIGIGGKYGQGALRVDGKTVDYYNLIGASVGFQLGGQKKSLILAFMDNQALTEFRQSQNYDLGIQASAAIITIGADGRLNLTELKNKPILVFIIDQKGLMYDLSLAGSKFTKIKK